MKFDQKFYNRNRPQLEERKCSQYFHLNTPAYDPTDCLTILQKMAKSIQNMSIFRKICSNEVQYYSQRRQLTVSSLSEAISRAEICLGYSIKDLSVKHIVCNQKLQSYLKESSFSQTTEHPVLLAERKLDPEIEVNYKSRALLTLLLAKAVSHRPLNKSPQFKFNLNLNKSGSLTKQLLLAETIELIYGGCVFHTTGVSAIKDITSTNDNKTIETLIKGNRLAVLTGDLMFTSATKNLVKLKNSRVTELMSKALRDFIEGEYLHLKLKEQIAIGNWTHILDNWVRITCLKSSSLIANGCQSMAHLSANCQTLEEQVYKFGYNIGFAWSLIEDSFPELKNLINSYENINQFIENISQDVDKSESIKKTQSLLEFYSNSALDQIKGLPESEAKTALSDIVLAMIQKQ